MINVTSLINMVPGIEYIPSPYLVALVIIVLSAILGKAILFIFSNYLERFAKKTKTKIDDILFERTKKPIFYFVVVFGIKVAVEYLAVDGIVSKLVASAMALVFVFILTRTLDVIIEAWGESFAKKTKTKIDEVLLPLFHKASKVVFVIIAILWVLAIWNINITPYLAGAGIVGIVLGMALQDSFKNVFGGVSIILDKSFKVGDPIRLDSGELGTVQEIGLRSTKMKTYDGEIIFVPNGELANSKIRNYVKPNTRVRKIVEFGVEYGSDIDNVKTVVMKVLRKVKDIYDDPYMDVIFVKMDNSSLNFQARFWVDWENAYTKWLEVNQLVYDSLRKAGIGIPFPTRTVHMINENKK